MTGTGSALPHDHFDTAAYAASRRLDAWREAISVLFEVHPTEPEAATAPVVVDSWQLGPAVLTAASGPGFSYDRSSRAIATDGLDLFLVQVYEVGRCSIRRGAPVVVGEPGDLVVTDLARPITTEETTFRNLNLSIPRSVLAPLLRTPDAHGGRVLRRSTPLVALFRAHLYSLARQVTRLSQAHVSEALSTTTQMLAAALNGGTDAGTVHGVRIALTWQIRRYIDEHLCSDDLTPESLAAHFRLSRATLYRLFVDEGGVRHLIRRRRLARARLGLVSPAQRHWTIAQIGVQAGYAHAQDFIRAYRREFDITPGDERELARAAGRMWRGGRASPRPMWADWVHRIGP